MANVSVYDPFAPGFTRLFQNLMRPFPEDRAAVEIKVDVTEDPEKYVVKADIPGVAKEAIKVDIDGNYVSISAEVKKEMEERKGETVVYSERYEGKAFRGFSLDREVDESKAAAKYADGVLELTLPKKANGSAKRLAVS